MLRTNSVCNLTASPDSQAFNKVSASRPAKDGCCCANASILFSFRLFTGSFYEIFGPPSGYLSRKTGKDRRCVGGESIMIHVTRLNLTPIVLNSDLIEQIETTPDTINRSEEGPVRA